MAAITLDVGDHVLVDPCRWGGAHPQAWLVGVVERRLELNLQRFLIRYLTPCNDLEFGIHTPRSIRAIGHEEHVRRVFDGVREHMKGFEQELAKLEKDQRKKDRKWEAYSAANDALEGRYRDIWYRQQDAMKVLRQPGLIRWKRNGGVVIDTAPRGRT
jgi:hypothetical protein